MRSASCGPVSVQDAGYPYDVLKSTSDLAILVSLLLMAAYISFRFQWKYSVGVLVALAHDLLIAIGIYALTGREVSVTIDLKSGDARATVWTNDLTHAYVHENSAYSS